MTAVNSTSKSVYDEGIREERFLMTLIVACLLLMPIKALSALNTLLYGLVLLLEALFVVVSAKRIKGPDLDMGLLASAGALILYMIARLLGSGSGAERILQTALFLLTLISFSRYQWEKKNVHKVYVALALLMTACFLYWFVSGRVTNYYKAFYGHSNGFAVVIIATLVVSIIDSLDGLKATHLAVGLICIVLLWFANSRSAILTVGVLLLAVAWLGFRKKANATRGIRVLFFLVLIGVLVFSVVYPSLYGTNVGYNLQMLSREYLNKNFFSGREVVWMMVLKAINGHELFGLGLQMIPSMIYDTGISSHNLYLQTILQSGIVGLALLFVLLWVILNKLSRNSNRIGCIGAALIVAMLVHECFEVSLTQNNLSYGLVIWAVLGICLSASGSQFNSVGLATRHLASLRNDSLRSDS